MKIEDYKNVTDRIEIREECRKEIINMSIEKNKSKHKWSKKTFIPVIAAAIVGCTAITAAFADDVISVFSKEKAKQEITAEVADGTEYKVNKGNQLNYDILEDHAESLSEECDTNGLKVKAESIFCDGENLTVIFTAENNNPDIENKYHIFAKGVRVDIGGKSFSDIDNMCLPWIDLIRDYEGASAYTGTFQMHIPENLRFTDTTDIKIHIGVYESADVWENGNILDYYEYCRENNIDYRQDPQGAEKYYSQFNAGGDFLLKVTPDMSANKINETIYKDEGSGIEICQVKSTPYCLSIKYKNSSEMSLAMLVYDENGNQLELNLANQGEYDGNYQTHNFSSTDSKAITVQFVDKNSENLDVVCSFEIPLD